MLPKSPLPQVDPFELQLPNESESERLELEELAAIAALCEELAPYITAGILPRNGSDGPHPHVRKHNELFVGVRAYYDKKCTLRHRYHGPWMLGESGVLCRFRLLRAPVLWSPAELSTNTMLGDLLEFRKQIARELQERDLSLRSRAWQVAKAQTFA